MSDSYDEMLTNRENMYRFLGRLYQKEVDETLWKQLKSFAFPDTTEEAALTEGYRELSAYLKTPGEDPLTDLACDYARIFLGAGVAKGILPIPCESVYTSRGHLVQQDAWEAVRKIYAQHGLGNTETDLYEDHLALELEFMAHLCVLAKSAARADNMTELTAVLADQKSFLEEHLLNWTERLAHDVKAVATTPFYRAVADITVGFLKLEKALMAELLPEHGTL